MQDFAASVREHVKNTRTKPVQADPPDKGSWEHYKQKNPGSAATETGIKSKTKASSFHDYNTSRTAVKATDIQGCPWLSGGAS
ncbi:hypothetical protein [Sulfitobacter sp. M368]|uniref:hypothetical protein n=1 Tax=Sulfitobacter sp. M368 TaxID=2867021 RepID=UPI0021A5A410|nr:hypothetical protein [Sulfitobacter sp. M368]UWR15612.1 hypothetical protein K3754_01535 [Sulfitobacter sp. M368]